MIFLLKKAIVNLILEQTMKAKRGSTGTALLYLSARWGWMVKATSRPLNPQERDPVPEI